MTVNISTRDAGARLSRKEGFEVKRALYHGVGEVAFSG